MRIPSLASFALLLASSLACGESGSSSDTGADADARRQFLAAFADEAVVPRLARFADQARALDTAAASWADDPANVGRRGAAQEAWVSAMDTWQELEVLQVGPAGAAGAIEGGQGLRDEIYSWPTVNACRVDQETIEDAAATAEGLRGELVNVRGLDALERLLFADTLANACPASSPLNLDGTWDVVAGEPGAIASRRARYAASAAALVRERAEELEAAWTGGFRDALATAGAGSETYATSLIALNSVSDALFYLEGLTVNMKIAEPAGLSGCETADTCPEARESLFANRSLANIQANHRGYVAGYRAGEGRGLDQLLRDVGASDFADRMDAALAAAEPVVAGLSGTVATLLDADPQGLDPVFNALQDVVRLQRTELVSVFNLRLPQSVAADND
ncbi:MAG: imelysin family protein [Myxococcota bacterium]